MIPRVRTWRVRAHRDGTIIKACDVQTINRRFAKWIGREQMGYPTCDKITAHPVESNHGN